MSSSDKVKIPLNEWARESPVKEFVHDNLPGRDVRQRGWYDVNKVEPILQSERAFGRNIWGLLCLELWAQTFLKSK